MFRSSFDVKCKKWNKKSFDFHFFFTFDKVEFFLSSCKNIYFFVPLKELEEKRPLVISCDWEFSNFTFFLWIHFHFVTKNQIRRCTTSKKMFAFFLNYLLVMIYCIEVFKIQNGTLLPNRNQILTKAWKEYWITFLKRFLEVLKIFLLFYAEKQQEVMLITVVCVFVLKRKWN